MLSGMINGLLQWLLVFFKWKRLVKRVLSASVVVDGNEAFEYDNQIYDKEKAVNAFVEENRSYYGGDPNRIIRQIAEHKKYIDENIKRKDYSKAKILKLRLEAFYKQLGQECPEEYKCETIKNMGPKESVGIKCEDGGKNLQTQASTIMSAYCRKCGFELPKDSRFCPKCGEKIVNPVSKDTPAQKAAWEADRSLTGQKAVEHKTDRKRIVILYAAIIFVLVLIGVYLGTYVAAKRAAINHDFNRAGQLLLTPQITQIHDPLLQEYIAAGQFYLQGEYAKANQALYSLEKMEYLDSVEFKKEITYYEALEQLQDGDVKGYKTIASLARNGFKLAEEGLDEAMELAYEKAVDLYRQGEHYNAGRFFTELRGYKRSADYSALISGNYYIVKQLIGFEDANDILVDKLADQFLLGYWSTSDGRYYFSIEEKNSGTYANYNLPCPDTNLPNYSISKGIYSVYDAKAPLTERIAGGKGRINLFQFTAIDADSIMVYCYKDETSYTLYRK